MIYYAHNMLIYGTEQEKKELKEIKNFFPGEKIYNPNGLKPGKGFETMIPYRKIVARSAAVVCSRFDGTIGRGIFAELEEAMAQRIPCYLLEEGKIFVISKIFLKNPFRSWKEYADVEVEA